MRLAGKPVAHATCPPRSLSVHAGESRRNRGGAVPARWVAPVRTRQRARAARQTHSRLSRIATLVATFSASQIVEAQWVARDRGLQRFVTELSPCPIAR